MKSFHIKIHSFSALITNSSSEVFVSADQSTIDGVKEIVNNLLKIGGSTLAFDDLFRAEIDSDGITVTVINDSVEAKRVAQLLSNLTGLFSIDATYNG
jgi:hypothetical protein